MGAVAVVALTGIGAYAFGLFLGGVLGDLFDWLERR